jgi:hypothetical protein
MTQEEKDFMEANLQHYETQRLGFVRIQDSNILDMYEAIYQKYLNKSFFVTKWCSNCVMEMIGSLYNFYLSLPQEEIQSLEKPKRGRPRK